MRETLEPSCWKILEAIILSSSEIDYKKLSTATGYQTQTVYNSISALVDTGLCNRPQRGRVVATEKGKICFAIWHSKHLD